jgi:Holliday junction resolvase
MSHYAAGAAFERKVRDRLLADGADLVIRSAGSKGPVDLVSFGEHWNARYEIHVRHVDLVQVKRGRSSMTRAAKTDLASLAKSIPGGRAILATPEKVGRKIEVRLEVL